MKKSASIFEGDILTALMQFSPEQLDRNAAPEEIAHVFAHAMLGFKQSSNTIEELKYKIDLLIKMSVNKK